MPAPDARAVEGIGTRRASLRAHFAHQQTDTSCSVASATVVLNAMRARAGQAPLTQAEVVNTDKTGHWLRATADASGTGVALDPYAALLRGACAAAGTPCRVEAVHVDDGPAALVALRAALRAQEAARHGPYIIANFFQATALAGGEAVGHLSPLAAYEEHTDSALVLDVDNACLAPYWVPLARLRDAMARADDGRSRGYLLCSPEA